VVFFRLPACGGRNRRGDSAAHTVGGLATAKNHFAVTDNDILDELWTTCVKQDRVYVRLRTL
jgi:hypothetical protein